MSSRVYRSSLNGVLTLCFRIILDLPRYFICLTLSSQDKSIKMSCFLFVGLTMNPLEKESTEQVLNLIFAGQP